MTPMKIPDEAMPGMKAIFEMAEDAFSSLVSAIESTKPTVTVRKFCEKISPKATMIPQSEVLVILTSLVGLFWMKNEDGTDSRELGVKVADAFIGSKKIPEIGSDDKKSIFAAR